MNMKDKSAFGHDGYKAYLREILPASGEGRGLRSRLAAAIGVQSAFISQVLNQKVHLSLEHALKVSQFLQHGEAESHYFMLLVEHERAGSPALRSYYASQMAAIREKRLQIAERLQVKQTLNLEDQLTYYSAWYYGAVHVLISIPELQTKAALAQHLRLELPLISEILDFLVKCGLAVDDGDHFRIGNARLHLGANSPLISKHHTNWRMRAVQALDEMSKRSNLHYSAAITLAREDVEKIRKVLLEAIERTENIYKPSKEETGYAVNLDFFAI